MCFKVDFCSNDDKSVPDILLCFSANIQWFYFFKSVAFRKTTRFSRKLSFFFFCFFLSMPKQCTGIPALKITLAHKCMISDVIWHKSIFSLVRSSPGGSYMSDQVKIILEHNAA